MSRKFIFKTEGEREVVNTKCLNFPILTTIFVFKRQSTDSVHTYTITTSFLSVLPHPCQYLYPLQVQGLLHRLSFMHTSPSPLREDCWWWDFGDRRWRQHKNHYHKNHGGPGNVDLKADFRVAEDAVCQGSGSDIGCCSRPRCLQ